MPTNQEYYGLESEWVQPNAANIVGTNRTNQWLTAYFGPGYNIGSVVYNAGSLASGLHNNKIPKGQQLTDGYMIDDPIDNSLSYCGLGTESIYSHLAYLEYKTAMCSNSFTAEEDRSVTNFAFCQTQGNDTGFYIYNNSSTSGGASINGSRSRFAPYGINGDETSITRANRNRAVTPYAQIPVRNTVFYPTLRVAANIQENPRSTSGMNIVNVDWEDYMNLQNSVNYTNHPYILRITMQAFTTRYVDDIDEVTGVPENDRAAMSSSLLSGIAVLSPSSVADGEPMDIANPTQNLTDIYTYYNTRSKFATNAGGVMLFGYTAVGLNDNDYINEPAPNVSVDASSQRLIFFPHPNAVLREAANNTNTSTSGWYYLEYYDGLLEWVMEQMACFGLFFTLDKATAARGALNDPLMFLGLLEAGIGHGKWTSGEENEEQEQWEWDTTNRSSYKPSDGGGGGSDDPYGDTTNFIKAGTGINPGGKWYADSNLGVWNGLLAWCNNLPVDGDDKLNLTQFYGQNPIDCIIEAKYIFVDDYTFGKTMGTDGPITLGSYNNGGVNSHPFSTAHPVEFDCGYVDITRPWEDFRDYEPYTTISLILPFSDSIDLPTDIFMGHRCNLKELIDPLTGDLIYYVFVDNILYTSLTGNCAMDLSINGLETATYAQTRFSLQTQATIAKFNAIASLIGGAAGASIAANLINPAGAVLQGLGGFVNMSSGKFQSDRYEEQMSRSAPPPAKIQKASSNVQWGSMPYPHIVVASPLMVDGYSDADYKTQTGFATYKVGKIGDEKGYVVCSSINPSGLNCSKEEVEMITNLLTQGIYIK